MKPKPKYDPALVSIEIGGQKVDGPFTEEEGTKEILVCRLVDGLSRSYFRALLCVQSRDYVFLHSVIRDWSSLYNPDANTVDHWTGSSRYFCATPDYYRESKFCVFGLWKTERLDLDVAVRSNKAPSKLRADRKAIRKGADAFEAAIQRAHRKEAKHDPVL